MNPQPVLTGPAEVLYRKVLRSGPATLDEHGGDLRWPVEETRAVFADLERLRLVRLAPDGVVRVDDPRASVGRLLDAEEADLDQRRRALLAMRESLESFELDYRRGLQVAGPRVPQWERVAPAQAPQVVQQLVRSSDGPILQVTRGISLGPGLDDGVRRHWEQIASSGRVLRTILPRSVLVDPHWHEFAEFRARAGEEQRYLPDDDLRVEFGVFGRAGVLLDEGGSAEDDFLLLRPAAVVDSFLELFSETWRRAEPVMSKNASAQDVRLLELLALGFKDEAIARQLGLGLRTVRRRVSALMDEHGVDTRFQLGLAVVRRGLID